GFPTGYVDLNEPVNLDNEKIGSVSISSDMGDLEARVSNYIGIMSLILLGSILVALLLSSTLQRLISEPIVALAQTANDVSATEDYSIRAAKTSEDEIGSLIDQFNGMLDQIQKREAKLQEVN